MAIRSLHSRRQVVLGAAGWAGAALLGSGVGAGATPPEFYETTQQGVRLRSRAGTSYRVVATLGKGQQLAYLADAGRVDGYYWAKVEVIGRGLVGYVAVTYIRPSQQPEFPVGQHVVVDTRSSSRAVLRSGPGTNAKVVTYLSNGTEGTVHDGPSYASGYAWYKVSFPTVTGWLVADVLT